MTPRILLTLALAAALALPAAGQTTRIRGFTDVRASVTDRTGESGTFGLGQFDLYITSQITDRLTFLGETVFEFEPSGGEFIVDVERVIVTYAVSPALHISAGKVHTPIGYWNTAYHHGSLLQPSIDRPLMFRFEDEGGVLPIHTVGILLWGRDLGGLHLGYDVMVGNGIGGTPVSDVNEFKSITVAVHSALTSTLTVGGAAYLDRTPPGVDNLAGGVLAEELTTRLFSGFVIYTGGRLEVMGEYLRAQHARDGFPTANNDAAYGYVGVRFGTIVPYVRVDRMRFDQADPYFDPNTTTLALGGLRFEISAAAALKLEAGVRDDLVERSAEAAAAIAIGF